MSDEAPSSVRVLRPRRSAPEDIVRPTRAEISLDALRHNLRSVCTHLAQLSGLPPKVWPVLKADAYGHGAPAVARTLERAGADGFCVALAEEGIELREAGIRAPILVMGGYYGHAYADLAHYRLTPVVYGENHEEALRLLSLGEAEGEGGARLGVHLKVDTGMGRLGVLPAQARGHFERLNALPNVYVSGLMTHFAEADTPDLTSMRAQLKAFEATLLDLRARSAAPVVVHAANSAATWRGLGLYDAVRPGLAMYGAPSAVGELLLGDAALRPALRLRTEIVDLRQVQAGGAVGYGGAGRVTRTSRVATVPIGYADGYVRAHSRAGRMLVRGTFAPVLGVVSMDMCMLDVTDVPGVSMADEVVVLGTQSGPLGQNSIFMSEFAQSAGQIPWEVMTTLSRRVPRFYREE